MSTSATGQHSTSAAARVRRNAALTLIAFAAVYALLQLGYMLLRGSPLESLLVDRATVLPAAHLISALFPGDGVVADGSRLAWSKGHLTLLNGCDGFEVGALFVAAVLVAPVDVRHGTISLSLGCGCVWALNQVRVATLYWAYRYKPGWFDSIHTVWGPAVLVAFVAGFFWGWVLKPRTIAGQAS